MSVIRRWSLRVGEKTGESHRSTMFSVVPMLLLTAGSCVNGLDLIQSDSVVVQPGQSVAITCQLSGYSVTDNNYATGWVRQGEGKPMDWISHMWGGGDFYQNDVLKNKFSYSRDTSAGTVTLKGQNLQPADSAVYYCVRRNTGYFDYWGQGTTVTVTSDTPAPPVVFPLRPCSSGTGSKVTIGCMATGFTPSALTFSWSKGSTALTDFVQYPAKLDGSVYTGITHIQVDKAAWDAKENFTCTATHSEGSVAKLVTPEFSSSGPDLTVLSSYNEQSEISFLSCFAKGFSPKRHSFKWLHNGKEVVLDKQDVLLGANKRGDGKLVFNAASFLNVSATGLSPDDKLACQFHGQSESGPKTWDINVPIKPSTVSPQVCIDPDVQITIIPPKSEDLFLNKKGSVVCEVKVNRPPLENITWEDDRGNVMAAYQRRPNGQKGTFSLSLDITYEEWHNGLERVCVIDHPNLYDGMKKTYSRKLVNPEQRPYVYMLPPLENSRKNLVTLTCYVKDFYPEEILVSWLIDDEPADSTYVSNTTSAIEKNGFYSVYSYLSISYEHWEKQDLMYSCVVYHETLNDTVKTISRSIGSRSLKQTNIVNLDLLIPDTCKSR